MNQSPFSSDDPLLTAYALGEIDEADRAAVEAAFAADPALRSTVAEIRATVAQLSAALATEPLPEVTHNPIAFSPPVERRSTLAKIIRLPQSYYLIGGLAAAGFAVLVFLQQPEPHAVRETRSLVAINLPAPVESNARGEIRMSDAIQAPAPLMQSASSETKAEDAAAKIGGTSTTNLVADVRQAADKAKEDAARVLETPGTRGDSDGFQKQVTSGIALTANSSAPAATGEISVTGPNVRRVALEKSAAMRYAGLGIPAEESARKDSRFSGGKPMPLDPVSRFLPDRSRATTNSESYGTVRENNFIAVAAEPLSTFSIDVDTASYANVRRFLTNGQLPPHDAVRIEELVNYFPYRYARPTDDVPFAASLEVASAPWENSHRLVRIGLKGREVNQATRPAANLVFLLDVSGSMNAPNRLPLVKESMRLLVGRLRADDHVAVVTYAGQSGLALPSTPVSKSNEILAALEELAPGGSTNGERGIQLAYDIAKANFVTGGVNRVILCTDGDFNVGVSNRGDLVRLIEEKAKANVFLTVLGFGMGNLKDDTLEALADKGNGNYGYIDSRREAEKLLVEQVGGTLVTIAKDVKIQVEFNPAQVSAYRLIGYENRLLQKEDFNNDKVDAGEIGAGHTVTALYEVIPAGADEAEIASAVDDLKYQTPRAKTQKVDSSTRRSDLTAELLTVKVRYKDPTGDVSRKLEFPLRDTGSTFATASEDFKFAAAVAEFGLVLRSPEPKRGLLTDVLQWVEAGASDDAGGYRAEFIGLVRQAQSLLRN